MSERMLSGVYTTVAVDITPGVRDGIAFGAINGKLCIGVTAQGRTHFVALGGDASHKLADALAEIASMETAAPGSIQ